MLTITALGGLLGAVLVNPIRRTVGTRKLLIGSPWLVVGIILVLPLATTRW